MGDAVITVRDLELQYFTRRGPVRAVDGVSFELLRGETLGLVGESGCGKTSLGTALLAVLAPPGKIVGGSIMVDGLDILKLNDDELRRQVRWEKVSMVFQGAMNSLTPVYTVGSQMNETLQRHKRTAYSSTSRREARKVIERYLEMVGLPSDVANRYPHELSGGMKQRVVIATALFLEPSVVVLDEPTTALDVIVQAQILNTIKELKRRLDLSLIFITHDLATEAEVADRVLVMYAGRIVESAPNETIFATAGAGASGAPGRGACHPYTRMLLAATPRLHERVREPAFIPGTPPDLLAPTLGCRFRPRCPVAFDRCSADPPLREVAPGHMAACWRCG
jgi:peptide/nickel transport system ATP-binding protein